MVHATGTYSNVDASVDPTAAADWLDTMADWPFVRAYKLRTIELLKLGPGQRVLDVGCGTGHDTLTLSETAGGDGLAVGLDASAVMLNVAKARGGSFVRGDARRLPFGDRCFDAARADRVLQHVASPETALAELARVVRPGGRMVVIDPDQETLVAEVPDQALARRVKDFRRDRNLCNGDLGHRLPRLFRRHGLVDVECEAATLVLTDPRDAFGFTTWARLMYDEGLLTAAELESWEAGLDDIARAGDFLYAVTFFIVSGTRA